MTSTVAQHKRNAGLVQELTGAEADIRLVADILSKLNERISPAQANELAQRLRNALQPVSRITRSRIGGATFVTSDDVAALMSEVEGGGGGESGVGSLSGAAAQASNSPRQTRLGGTELPQLSPRSTGGAGASSSGAPAALSSRGGAPEIGSTLAPAPPPMSAATPLRRGRNGDASTARHALGGTQGSGHAPSAFLSNTLGSANRGPASFGLTLPGDTLTRAERERESVDRSVTSAAFLLLESALIATGAASGAVYLPRGDEMVCVCCAGVNATTPPQSVRHLAANSMTRGVWSSGVAIHQRKGAVDDNDLKRHNLLIFPVPIIETATGAQKEKGNASASVGFGLGASMAYTTQQSARGVGGGASVRHGVLQLSDKYLGARPFSEADEVTAALLARLLGALMSRYPTVGWFSTWFDPVACHRVSPFVAPSLLAEATGILPSAIEAHSAPTMIHRTTVPISLTRRAALGEDAAPLGAGATLQELDSYVNNLQDCWKRSVRLNADHHASEQARSRQVAQLRDELNKARAEIKRLSEQVRLDGLSAADYRQEYTTLQQELDAFLERRALMSGGTNTTTTGGGAHHHHHHPGAKATHHHHHHAHAEDP